MRQKRGLNKKALGAIAIIAALLAWGCEDTAKPTSNVQQKTAPAGQMPSTQPPAATPSTTGGAAITSRAATLTGQGSAYTSGAKRDPFVSLTFKSEVLMKQGVGSLESFDVGEFQLIAILWDSTGPYTAVTLPDGKSYTVRQGTKVGLHGGKVVKITQDSLIIREMVKNYKGVLAPKDTVLKLRRGDEQ